jgi:hypothetical protein
MKSAAKVMKYTTITFPQAVLCIACGSGIDCKEAREAWNAQSGRNSGLQHDIFDTFC